MITPSFSISATERVLPKLALDFTSASLDSRITFTRTTDATHPATYVNGSGYVTTATNNQARFDFDPITLVCKGLLIEESRTNLLTYSEQFDNAAWTKQGATVTQNATIAPDGTLSADAIIETVSTGFHRAYQTPTVSNVAQTFSVYVKSAGRDWVFVRMSDATNNARNAFFNINTGVVGTVDPAYSSTSIKNAGNGWYRISASMPGATSGTPVGVSSTTGDNVGSSVGDGVSGFYQWGAQLEAGAFPTSYIPTTTTALTRNADVATMTGTNFSSWYNASEGTFVCQADRTYSGNFAAYIYPFCASDNTNNNEICSFCIPGGTQTAIGMAVSGVGQVDYSARAWNTEPSTVAVGYKQNNTQFGMNGVSNAADTTCSIPTVSQLAFGRRNSGGYWTGHIKKFNYYIQKLTGSELAAFSK